MRSDDEVLERFAQFKEISDPDELAAARLWLDDGAGSLVPLCRLHAGDRDMIETLARWRVRNMAVYPTQFTVTFDGTAAWLRDRVLAVPDRLLFLVADAHGTPVGTAGLADAGRVGEARLESVMRGTDAAPPGIMPSAVVRLLRWARAAVGLKLVRANVFSDNERIIRLLHGLGFRDDGLVPLRAEVDGDRVEYVPAGEGPSERFHLRLVRRLDDEEQRPGCET